MSDDNNMNINVRHQSGVTSAYIGSANENLSADDPLGDAEALRRAFQDPRYKTSASYRKVVEDAVAESLAIKGTAPGASILSGGQLNGRYQVRGNPNDEPAPAARELTEHEIAMIKRAERAGL